MKTLTLVLVLVLAPAAALAHGVNVFAWVENGQVHSQSRFSKDRPVAAGTLRVYAGESDEMLLETKVGGNGITVFDLPEQAGPAGLRLELQAGEGHRDEWFVQAEEYMDVDAGKTSGKPAATPEIKAVSLPDDARLEALVGRVVEEKLAPVKRMLAKSSASGPSATEIAGGIGYVFGLFGILAWLRASRRGK